MSDLIQRLRDMGTTLSEQAAAVIEITQIEQRRLTARVIGLDAQLTAARDCESDARLKLLEAEDALRLLAQELDGTKQELATVTADRDRLEALRQEAVDGLKQMADTITTIQAA